MGGSNEQTISGLRFHVNDGEQKVHIHDDSGQTKFTLDRKSFREQMKSALEDIRGTNGIMSIEGDNRIKLYVMNDSGNYRAFLSDGSSVKNKIEDFLKGC
jgi:hypothetical protein